MSTVGPTLRFMAVQPIIVPRFRAFDSNGDPLSGGLLYSYEAGTTTPLATYTTRAGDVANANPVVLDANGEADVWVTGGTLYKFVLRDSAGVLQWSSDNVPSTDADFAVPDGNVSAPGLAFANDPNTGVYRSAADTVAVAAGGVQSALFTATGVTIPGTLTATGGLAAALPAGGFKITGLGAPTDANDAARKTDVDAVSAVSIKAWARIQTDGAGNVSLIDGYNVTSVALNGTNRVDLALTTALANPSQSIAVVSPIHTGGTTIAILGWSIGAAVSVYGKTLTTAAAVADINFSADIHNFAVVVFGD